MSKKEHKKPILEENELRVQHSKVAQDKAITLQQLQTLQARFESLAKEEASLINRILSLQNNENS